MAHTRGKRALAESQVRTIEGPVTSGEWGDAFGTWQALTHMPASLAMRLDLFEATCVSSPFVAPRVKSGIPGVLAANGKVFPKGTLPADRTRKCDSWILS